MVKRAILNYTGEVFVGARANFIEETITSLGGPKIRNQKTALKWLEKTVGELECDELCLREKCSETFVYCCLNDKLISAAVGCHFCKVTEKYTPFLFCGRCKLTVCQGCHSLNNMTVIPRKKIKKVHKIGEVSSRPKSHHYMWKESQG